LEHFEKGVLSLRALFRFIPAAHVDSLTLRRYLIED